ncbi:hypothetical protein IW261DRAFT_1665074 [Armillaria novae-zelandiae]|uniref:Uncharacterized protein n=1 Tax=Armillaria novae-zelandiae TaxID=153914 RepID=A0AA39NV84_9AGAR|nr:hypothetical protein IW261DRAFT_1665074 [Armillaria novae-zelandiae]
MSVKALGDQIHILMTSRPLDTMQSFILVTGLAGGNLPTLLSNDESLHERICKTVVKKADGTFLLANIHMKLLTQCTNRHQLDTKLDKLLGTLRNAYEHLLARIDSLPNKDLACHVFGWVAFTAHPLKVEALQHALAIESGTKKVDPTNITNESILLSICAGLVIIVDNKRERCFKFVCEYYFGLNSSLFIG